MMNSKMVKLYSLFVAACLLLVGAANAEDYKWTAGDVDSSFTVNLISIPAGSSVDIFSWSTGKSITLFGAESPNSAITQWVMTVESEGLDGYYKFKVNKSTIFGGDYLELGKSTDFGFRFYDSSNVYKYTISSLTDPFYLNSANSIGNNIKVTGSGVASVSAVPIPGSALLLGSGVIGLLGIGSRRKKDNA